MKSVRGHPLAVVNAALVRTSMAIVAPERVKRRSWAQNFVTLTVALKFYNTHHKMRRALLFLLNVWIKWCVQFILTRDGLPTNHISGRYCKYSCRRTSAVPRVPFLRIGARLQRCSGTDLTKTRESQLQLAPVSLDETRCLSTVKGNKRALQP